jgi:hypothetical protein
VRAFIRAVVLEKLAVMVVASWVRIGRASGGGAMQGRRARGTSFLGASGRLGVAERTCHFGPVPSTRKCSTVGMVA